MLRNAVLLISTLGILGVLYIAYSAAFVTPVAPPSRGGTDALPTSQPTRNEDIIKVGPVELSPGQGVAFTTYDPKSGRPTGNFRCASWKLVPGSKNNVDVDEPTISLIMPSGMAAVVSAKHGQLFGDRVQDRRMEPKRGWLAGDASIVIDRETKPDRPPLDERPWDQIIIEMERLEFDFDQGRLETESAATVLAEMFEVRTKGLKFIWNQGSNRVDLLDMPNGGEMTLFTGGPSGDAAASQPASGTASAPASRPTLASKPSRPRRPTTYVCTIDGGVVADQFERGRRTGGLEADGLRLTFDVGAGVDDLFQGGARSSRDRRHAVDPSRSRLIVRWAGQMRLSPTETPAKLDKPRRHFEALGPIVKLDLDDRCVLASELVYHDETQRLWLTPRRGEMLELQLGNQGVVKAQSLFVDLQQHLIKLVGDVKLDAGTGRGAGSVRCDIWAELRLRKPPVTANASRETATSAPAAGGLQQSAFASLGGMTSLESALFVGNAMIDLNGQTLQAGRLETFFREHAPNENIQQSLDHAVANDDVRLIGGESTKVSLGEMLATKARQPLRSFATIRRSIARDREQSLRCAQLSINFDRGADGRPYAGDLDAVGPVTLRDAKQNVRGSARGLFAVMREGNRIEHAILRGNAAAPATLKADTFRVSGGELLFNPDTQAMDVSGASTLQFRSDRSLRGEKTTGSSLITVKSRDRLSVSGSRNEVSFVGDVVASSADDSLRGDTLTLTLADVVQPSKRPVEVVTSIGDLVRVALRPAERKGARDGKLAAAPTLTSSPGSDDSKRSRKEVIRAVAMNAVVSSEIRTAGDPLPLVSQNIAAPELQMDVRGRQIHTVGETTLLMLDRRLEVDLASAQQASGLPSALISRGPSQTLMKCARSMTYSIGEDGPERRDSVVFDGDVELRHVAGKDMVKVEEMLPQLAGNPQALAKLKSRNTYLDCNRLEGTFAFGESGESRGPKSRAPRLIWLAANENVYLRDQQGAGIREVYAHQLEFDRPSSKIRVVGSDELKIDARVYYQNTETGQYDKPAVGKLFIIDLESNTLKTGAVQGEFRRQ